MHAKQKGKGRTGLFTRWVKGVDGFKFPGIIDLRYKCGGQCVGTYEWQAMNIGISIPGGLRVKSTP